MAQESETSVVVDDLAAEPQVFGRENRIRLAGRNAVTRANIQAYDREAREKLKRLSLQLTGDPGR